MSTKKKGLLTTSGEWAKHLRPISKRMFWKGERQTERRVTQGESVEESHEDK